MRCIKCKKNAVVIYHGYSFCQEHFDKYLKANEVVGIGVGFFK